MRVLLDECVPRRLRTELAPHLVRTVVEAGGSGIKNGQLLLLASTEFECFITVDRNLQFQQNVEALPVAALAIRAVDNRFQTLLPLMPAVREALATLKPKELRIVGV